MVKLSRIFRRLSSVRVGIIGDFMYDTYTTGKVLRISPEAPVPVLHVLKEEARPGGAGNVALNLISLGAQVVAIGRVGPDIAGQSITNSLASEGVVVDGIVIQTPYQTPVKNRVIADAQQVLRIDFEAISSIPPPVEQQIIAKLPQLFDKIDILAVSDYAKGFLSPSILKAAIEMAKARNIPVIVDPKGDDFAKYQGATVLKPNLQEAYTAAKLSDTASLEHVAETLFKKVSIDLLMITRSEAGISLFSRDGRRHDFPVRSKEVKDVTGAGDTVLAMVSVALGNKLDIADAAQLANIAAGIAIERLGCARIHLSDLASRLLEFDVDNKVFDEDHLFALQQALKDKHYIVLGIHSTLGITTALFRSIRQLAAQESDGKLIIYVRDSAPDSEFISLLSSLAEVDFVVLKCESLKHLCEIIHPQEVYVIENQNLVALDHFNALLN